VDVGAWLRDLGLGRYERAFVDNHVDGDLLPGLTSDDLKELGVASLGHRRRILAAIAALTDQGTPDAAAGSPSPAAAEGGAELRQLTVMFVDLVGSTELSGRLDPEEMRELVRGYQNAVAGEVARFGGHLAQYLGDGALAYFGWPRAHEAAAERAARAGLAVAAAVAGLDGPDGAPLAARVGIATGPVVVGDLIGSGEAQVRAAVGETLNLAARLQGVAEPGAVVIAAGTRRLLGGLFAYRDLGPATLKGFAGPVAAYQLLGEGAAEGRFEALHGGAGLTPLVGRRRELELLLERWRRAREGEGGQVVLVSGERASASRASCARSTSASTRVSWSTLGSPCSARRITPTPRSTL
jgi:class 3 adenylate cyclase